MIYPILIALLFFPYLFATGAEKLTERVKGKIEQLNDFDNIVVWVFLQDKGDLALNKSLSQVESSLTHSALERRKRNRPADSLVDEFDIPVNSTYVRKIADLAIKLRHRSRWLNAVSVEVNVANITAISSLHFVTKIDVVNRSRRRVPEGIPISKQAPALAKQTSLDYGSSFDQNNQINAPALHDQGFDGSGVIICVQDAGFNNLGHEVFQNISILATRDFVNGDDNVDDEAGQLGSGSHGTFVLSTIGGFKEGRLIGSAYNADYILAKTENTDSELHIEEDNWVASAEWADSLGADIISSSLGYLDFFTDGESNYSWEDMDGSTAIVTIGAEVAASRGILVVNSAGNEGPANPGENSIIGPCDGENVLCVGAVDASGNQTNFSSEGPTADGRIKPDVMAMGRAVVAASTSSPSGYVNINGTSFSCPITAGGAALLLQAVSGASNLQIMNALRSTASQASAPDNSYGWGIIDLKGALAALQIAVVGGQDTGEPSEFTLRPAYPNPFNQGTVIEYDLQQAGHVTLTVYNLLGQEVVRLENTTMPAGTNQSKWAGLNSMGKTVAGGVYIYRLQTDLRSESGKVLFLK